MQLISLSNSQLRDFTGHTHVRFRYDISLTPLVSMPETPVHEYHRAIPAQHDIRTTRQARMIQPIAEATCKEVLPHQHLRFGVLAMYCRHTAMPLLFCHLVHYPLVVVTAKVGILFFTKRWHDRGFPVTWLQYLPA